MKEVVGSAAVFTFNINANVLQEPRSTKWKWDVSFSTLGICKCGCRCFCFRFLINRATDEKTGRWGNLSWGMIPRISTTMTPPRWGRLCYWVGLWFKFLVTSKTSISTSCSFTYVLYGMSYGISFLQGVEDPLGSIHLRGSVVTAVDYVPDGETWPLIPIYSSVTLRVNDIT